MNIIKELNANLKLISKTAPTVLKVSAGIPITIVTY
jgi:hypothetical protein